jgi:hypothetical protein
MKTRVATILFGIVMAAGMASPSWAQGSEEHSDNGGGHPGVSIGRFGPRYHRVVYAPATRDAYAHTRRHARISKHRR